MGNPSQSVDVCLCRVDYRKPHLSLYFTKALFTRLLAQSEPISRLCLAFVRPVKNAPLYFYNGVYDYGAIFYAARRIPVLQR